MKVSHPFIYSSHLLVNKYNIIFYHSISSDSYTALFSPFHYPTCCSGITACCYGITASVFLHSPTYSDSQIEASKYIISSCLFVMSKMLPPLKIHQDV